MCIQSSLCIEFVPVEYSVYKIIIDGSVDFGLLSFLFPYLKIFNPISQSTLELCLSVSKAFHTPICTWCCTQPS